MALAVAGLALGLGVTMLFRPATPPSFMVLHQPFEAPVTARDRLDAWLPQTAGWAWAWRVEAALFGQRQPVNIFAEVVSLADSSPALLASLALGAPSFSEGNGLQVWLLSADELKALRQRFKETPGTELLLRPRITTADGIESALFQGESVSMGGSTLGSFGSTNQVGLIFGCFPRVRRHCTDLMAWVSFSERQTNQALGSASLLSIKTNLDAALRLQIPHGSGFLLLDRTPADSTRNRMGLIIDPPQPKKSP